MDRMKKGCPFSEGLGRKVALLIWVLLVVVRGRRNLLGEKERECKEEEGEEDGESSDIEDKLGNL